MRIPKVYSKNDGVFLHTTDVYKYCNDIASFLEKKKKKSGKIILLIIQMVKIELPYRQ